MLGDKSTHEVVELDRGNTLVDTRDDLLRYGRRVDVIAIEAVTQSGHTCCDLVELYAFFATITFKDEHLDYSSL